MKANDVAYHLPNPLHLIRRETFFLPYSSPTTSEQPLNLGC